MSDVCMIYTLFICGHENAFTLLSHQQKKKKDTFLLAVSVITALDIR